MKKIWLNCFLIAGMILLSLVSCKKNEEFDNPEEPINPADTVIHLMTYYTNFTRDEVSIATDTSLIVKTEALDSMDVQPRNLIVVWRSVNEDAFVRRVVSTEVNGENTIIRTSYADMGDLFPNSNLEMNSEYYINDDMDALTADGMPQPERYRDENGVYHPYAYAVPEEHEMVKSICPTRESVDGRVYITAEELYAYEQELNASIKFNLLDINLNMNGWTPVATSDSLIRITCDTLMLRVQAGVNMSIQTSWFKIKKFESVASAELSGNLTTSMYIGLEKKKEWEKEIASWSGATSTFMIGPVPVVIQWKPSIVFDAELEGSVGVVFTTNLGFNLAVKQGQHYENGIWTPISDYTKEFHAGISAGVQGKIGAEVGVYVEGDMLFYGAAGPEIKFGPSLYAEGSAEVYGAVTTEGKYSQIKLAAEVGMKLKAKLGAKIQILKWKLAEWQAEFEILKVEFWKGEKIIDL